MLVCVTYLSCVTRISRVCFGHKLPGGVNSSVGSEAISRHMHLLVNSQYEEIVTFSPSLLLSHYCRR